MGIGSFTGKKNLINDELSRGLSEVLTNIALPTLVVNSFIISYCQELLDNMLENFTYKLKSINKIRNIISKIYS